MAGQLIGCVTLLVQDYDEAISYFGDNSVLKLSRTAIVDDRDLGGGKRWVLVDPRGAHGHRLLLAKVVSRRLPPITGQDTADVTRPGSGSRALAA